MLPLNDPKWKELKGGYRLPFDPSPHLERLRDSPSSDTWEILWDELHHQGDVDLASYAAIPHLVQIHDETRALDVNLYALAATIEICRHTKRNPELPEWLKADYENAWRDLHRLAIAGIPNASDSLELRHILSVLALFRGFSKLGALLNHLDDSELDEIVEEYLGWSSLYGKG